MYIKNSISFRKTDVWKDFYVKAADQINQET